MCSCPGFVDGSGQGIFLIIFFSLLYLARAGKKIAAQEIFLMFKEKVIEFHLRLLLVTV